MYSTTTPGNKFTDDDKNAICNAYPASGSACADTSECSGGLACINAKCTLCKADADCGSNSACEDGFCIKSCKSNTDCTGGLVCREGRCNSCVSDTECGSDRYCDQDVCAAKCKDAETDCLTDQLCMSDGRCIDPNTCATHDHCPTGEFCRISSCQSTADLGKTCQGQKDCGSGLECLTDEGKSFCTSWCLKQGSPCPKGYVCKPFDEERSFCAIAPKAPTTNNNNNNGGGSGNETGGAGCNVTRNPSQLGTLELLSFLFAGLWLVLAFRRRQRA